jgi:hypothetical protein
LPNCPNLTNPQVSSSFSIYFLHFNFDYNPFNLSRWSGKCAQLQTAMAFKGIEERRKKHMRSTGWGTTISPRKSCWNKSKNRKRFNHLNKYSYSSNATCYNNVYSTIYFFITKFIYWIIYFIRHVEIYSIRKKWLNNWIWDCSAVPPLLSKCLSLFFSLYLYLEFNSLGKSLFWNTWKWCEAYFFWNNGRIIMYMPLWRTHSADELRQILIKITITIWLKEKDEWNYFYLFV